MRNDDWYKIKAYPHIGLPLTWNDREKTLTYIKNPQNIEKHSFLPFIHRQIKQQRFRKKYDLDGNVLNDGKRQLQAPKVRNIYFANHLDANIYSYYASILSKHYERVLSIKDLKSVVTAYRRVPLIKNGVVERNKCNIDFANDIFTYIESANNLNTIAITFDIKSFFDNLNHETLRNAWCNILETKKLSKDHYQVFKNITKFSYIEEQDLFSLFKHKLIVKSSSGDIRLKAVKKVNYFRDKNVIAYCYLKDISHIRSKGLIRSNKRLSNDVKFRQHGICQGSPISAVLANIYMLEFDELVNHQIQQLKGIYRRYSDDMVIVCDVCHRDYCVNLIEKNIKKICDLELQNSKTQFFHFTNVNSRKVCAQEFNGHINQNSMNYMFEYLGFAFDGTHVFLKTSSLAKYYRKMKKNVRRSKYYASTIKNDTNGMIFRQRLFKRFSYIGAKRKRNWKYIRANNTTDKWRKTNFRNWGNFITYAMLAHTVFSHNRIKGQVKNHWKNLNKEIKKVKNSFEIKYKKV
jgi:hypothetical protein